jgi:hypothetical protein
MIQEVATFSGSMLDLAVARAQGFTASIGKHMDVCIVEDGGPHPYSPSTQWYQAGHIIEEHIDAWWRLDAPDGSATFNAVCNGCEGSGDTPLEACMRAFVRSVYGDHFDDETFG